MKFCKFYLFVFIILFSSCGANLYKETLSIAIVDEEYSESLRAEDTAWHAWDDSDIIFSQSYGELPDGVVLSSSGTISGAPAELGTFHFHVTAYAITDGWDSWEYDDDGDDVSSDMEEFTLFVTERSTNADCPAPNDETTSETYICLGALEAETFAQDDWLDLDVNYFVNFDNSLDYDIQSIDFTILYDDSLFTPDETVLNSQLLRESATYASASVNFDNSVPGELNVVVTSTDRQLHKSGRLMNIPFIALQDIPAGTYDFTVEINEATSAHDDVSLPQNIGVDGFLMVDESL